MQRALVVLAIAALTSACSSDAPGLAADGADGSVMDGSSPPKDGGAGNDRGTEASASPPAPSGCIDDVSPGDHVYTCEGLRVDARIPAACEHPGCGLILELHGDTGTGLLIDEHLKLRDLGALHGYVVFAPTGPPYGGGQPGSTWSQANDASLVTMTRLFASVFRVDDKKIHATGFSRGGFVTWRLLCEASNLFASFAPAAAGDGPANGDVTCFAGTSPTRQADLLFLMGRTDGAVPYSSMVTIRDAAITSYGGAGPQVVMSNADYTHNRWTNSAGVVIETFDHAYETVNDGPWASAKGHCVPGSTMDPYAPQYAVPCKLPNAFGWGEEVMKFFMAHPKN
ncbi:MAG: hypothetical protein ABIP39_11600 [Polyangiaceae bacterium]